MSLDSFFGSESVDGAISADKVKEFQERMARNAAAMAAARQQEQKQKKKEDRLAAILLRFIQTSARNDLVLLVARCLEQNIPAVFVLSLILLGDDAMQKEMGVELHLLGGQTRQASQGAGPAGALPAGETVSMTDRVSADDAGKMVPFGQDGAIPLKLRIEIELWTQAMWEAMAPIPERILKTAVEFKEDPDAVTEPKAVVSQLAAFVLRDFFQAQGVDQPFENLKNFAEFVLKGLFKRLEDQVKDQKQLGSHEV